MTLVEFLRARLAEDERIAQATSVPGRWNADCHVELEKGCRCGSCYGAPWAWEIAELDGPDSPEGCYRPMHIGYADAEHIARHNPARVLAEVAAKRRLIDKYVTAVRDVDLAQAERSGASTFRGRWTAFDEVLRLLALPYAGHPDYRAEEWAP